ncbi:efflux RND transporter periplasmic adaptor subunit [Candidatus Fukatsuia symbiotica]|uniref:Efflux RND transporter periplasmic adaptor subunit n=1 Tax=Candidatus Fukatsuia symbiotica TaxID=1878942 RepID=A0A2U8I7V4_9GAMM|nr:efflux RND transporter periplasmic adaptor subunit [Candidatus Fukatsuia symbiotica]AWK15183.1 efflux RND transporter periplasmic adaptor subunit [Candidatus Fukatsuia symbiotica]MEA9444015.1 efflux RND transporter periplasmic adaptor subunit [Candidatus Fukatsuia symbiotica]
MSRTRKTIPPVAVLILVSGLVLIGCNDKETSQSTSVPPVPEVGIVTVQAQDIKMTTELPGRTLPSLVAEVRPQVSGIILKRNYVEGSEVAAGTSLYQIDPAVYHAAYNSAKGDLTKAQAAAEIARLTVNRYKPLLGTNYISKQEYDQASSSLLQANAAVLGAKASLETARINLAYTKVISPITGRSGKSSVTKGALVTNGQATALTTIQQLDPMYVDVTQSSDDFLRLKKELANGVLKQENGKAKVHLLLENGREHPLTGTLKFSDVTVDESTGSITLRAVFPNHDGSLLPGMFVRARLDEGVRADALLVPQQGITRNPRGDATAMVVNKDDKVELRELTTAQAIGDKWLVTAGLQPGDRVIVTGLQKIKPGVAVKAQEVNNSAATAVPNASE